MKTIYCLSGIGADQRIFKRLKLNARLHFLPWVPFDKHDDLPCYAQKMATQIPDENPCVLGLSFGGMLGTEIAKTRSLQQLFLVSSAKTRQELPEMNVFLEFMIDHKLIPYGLFKKPTNLLYNRFGAHTEEAKKLLEAIMADTDDKFLAWAFKAILNWHNNEIPAGIVHLHGTADEIIPPANVEPNYWIRDGSHMMIFNQADTISTIINQHLES